MLLSVIAVAVVLAAWSLFARRLERWRVTAPMVFVLAGIAVGFSTQDVLADALNAEIAQHAAVVDVPVGKGHVVVFSNNPIWRGETQGSYFLVFNAILNFDQLDAGRKLDAR